MVGLKRKVLPKFFKLCSGGSLASGLGISSVSVGNSCASADKEDGTNARFFQACAENTQLPDNCIDRICSGMLHRLDLSCAFPKLGRILKPSCKILAVEALDYNPEIKRYRMLMPDMRTE